MLPLSDVVSFVIAATVLILLPGPNMFFLIARGVASGRRAAFISALGIETAASVFVLGAVVGVSAVLAASAIAFAVVRYVGAAYLFFLAVRALLGHGDLGRIESAPVSVRRAYGEAFLIGITNPKVALFFVAFFPQFVDPHRGSVAGQTIVLGAIFVAIACCFDIAYALASGSIGRLLARRPVLLRRQKYLSAGAFFALGTYAAVVGGRPH
jgi:threonine/homoserine/homoserine lactone efflux protein